MAQERVFMKKTDLAWAAGIIDGEGSIFIQKCNSIGKVYPTAKRKVRREKSPTYNLRMAVQMVDKKTITVLANLFGGKCRELVGRTTTNRKVYAWATSGYNALAILRKIEPYSITKKNQIKVAKKFMSIPIFVAGRGTGNVLPKHIILQRECCYKKMKSFNYGRKA